MHYNKGKLEENFPTGDNYSPVERANKKAEN